MLKYFIYLRFRPQISSYIIHLCHRCRISGCRLKPVITAQVVPMREIVKGRLHILQICHITTPQMSRGALARSQAGMSVWQTAAVGDGNFSTINRLRSWFRQFGSTANRIRITTAVQCCVISLLHLRDRRGPATPTADGSSAQTSAG